MKIAKFRFLKFIPSFFVFSFVLICLIPTLFACSNSDSSDVDPDVCGVSYCMVFCRARAAGRAAARVCSCSFGYRPVMPFCAGISANRAVSVM